MNKRLRKRIAAAVLSLCLLGALVACGSGGLTTKDAETYVKGYLNAIYMGTYDQAYIDLVEDMTKADAEQKHENAIEGEIPYLLSFLEIDYPTDEMEEQAADLMEKIYAKANYTIGTASKTKDRDFVVEVTIAPLDLYNLLTDEDYFDALEQSGFYEAETEEEYIAADAIYGPIMLDLLEERLDEITYGEEQIIIIQFKKDDEGYYSPVDTGLQNVYDLMVDYFGYYSE